MSDVTVPSGLWEPDEDAAISTWLYTDGDRVQQGVVIAEIMVQKSSFELTAPATGVLRVIAAIEQPLTQGEIVGRIETE